jgi:hypothetical protein
MLTEQTESFITGQYQSGYTGDYPTAAFPPAEQRTGGYPQYRGDAPATVGHPTVGHPAAGHLPAYGAQEGRQATGQPLRAIGGPAGSGSAASGWPAQPGGQYNGQRQPQQQQRPPASARQSAPLPAMPLSAPVPADNGPATGASPAAQPGGGAPAKGGLNPYDVAITGSYPYPGQTYSAARPGPAQAGPAQAGVDDPYYRPLPADGYPSGGGEQGMSDPARAGYGASYGNGHPDPRDQRY